MMTSTSETFRRRAISVPAMLGTTALALAGFPWIVGVALAADLIRGRTRFPLIRSYLFALQYLVNDSVEIIAAPLLWSIAGFGRHLDSPASIRRHERLQSWSLALLAKRAEQLLGLRVAPAGNVQALTPGPVIVLSRHVSVLDASLPALVCQRAGVSVRGVVMAEMLADPGFDLIYQRTGSVFIPRDDGPSARDHVATMTKRGTQQTAYVIFPEGRLVTPSRRQRSLARLADRAPERAARLERLERLLPPRPGGVLALLEALPDADVVLLDHRGLERFTALAKLFTSAPVHLSIDIRLRRLRRSDIPKDPEAQVAWLDQLWLDLDASLDSTPGP